MPLPRKHITVHNIRLAYTEQNHAAQQTIVFIHGNSYSSDFWKKQFTDPLLNKYRLIAIDFPAHGDSDASAMPEVDYSFIGLGKIMAAAVNALVKTGYVIVGFSLGTNVVAEMLPNNLQPAGVVLAGGSIYGGSYDLEKIFQKGYDTSLSFDDHPTIPKVKAHADYMHATNNEEDKVAFIDNYFTVKGPFRSTLLKTFMAGEISNEVAILQQQTVPILLVFGKEEKIVYPHYMDDAPLHYWRAQVFKLAGANHMVPIDQPAAFNKLLAEYCADMFTAHPA